MKYLLTTSHHSKLQNGLALVFMLLSCQAWGQVANDSDETDQAFKELIMMQADTSFSKKQVYDKVLDLTKTVTDELQSSPRGVESYKKGQDRLKSLYSLLRSGAGHFSQMHEDSIALIYAQAAVDIAMFEEMKDAGLRQSPDYPNVMALLRHTTDF